MSERVQQVNQLLKQAVGQYLQENLGGHAGVLTITAVQTTTDLRVATCWYGYVGTDLGTVMAEIKRERRPLQMHINKLLKMKNVPKIVLKYDKSGDYAVEISKIIDDVNQNHQVN